MTEVGRAEVAIVPKAGNFKEDARKQIEPQLNDLFKGLAAGVAAKKIFDFGKDAFNANEEAVKIGKQTEAVIKSTGAAANLTADQIGDLSEAISKKTAVDDEAIQTGANLLLTFKGVKDQVGEGNDIFSQATAVMVDMAAAMGTDASGGAIQLGKALNDPIAGIAALTRVGVVFTDAQKEQIKTLAEHGDILGAQKIILAELTDEFGGSAEAQATGADRAKLAFGNLQETIGAGLTPAIEKASIGLVKLFDGIGALPAPVQTATLVLAGFGAAAFAIGKTMDFVSKTTDSLAPITKRVSKALFDMGEDGSRSLSKLGKGAAIAGGALAAIGLVLAVKQIADDVDMIELDLQRLAGASEEQFARVSAGVADALRKGRDIGTSFFGDEQFRQVAESSIDAATRLSAGLRANGEDTARYDAILRDVIENTNRKGEADKRSAEALKASGQQYVVTEEDIANYTKAQDANTKSVEAARITHEDLWDAMKEGSQVIDDLIESVFGITNADAAWNEAYEKVTETIRKNGTTLDVWTEKGRENRGVLEEMVSEGGKWLAKIYEQEGASANFKGSSSAIRQSIIDTMKQLGFGQKDIQTYIETWDKVPSLIETEARTNFTVYKGPGWDEYFRNLDNFAGGAEGGNFVPVPSKIPRFGMGGTNYAPGGLMVVGERGPELAHLGGTTAIFPSNVFEAQMARAMASVMKGWGGGGSPVNVYVDNVSHGDAYEVASMVGQGVQRVMASSAIGVGVRQGARR